MIILYDFFRQLTKENKRLSEICSQETKQKKRLSLYNEELQWKLKQNSEVVNVLLQGQTPSRKPMHDTEQSLCDDLIQFHTPQGSFLNRSLHSSSFNEKHFFTHSFERTLSFKERSRNSTSPNNISDTRKHSNRSAELFDLEISPPSSPKVKGVVEKSDSVSWVLDLDESPEVLASRMVRRAGSFRSSTPPKQNTPTKSPAIKRARTKSNTLSLSASSSAIVNPSTKPDRFRSKSVSLRDTKSPERDLKKTSSKSWQLKSLRNQKSIDRSDSEEVNSKKTISVSERYQNGECKNPQKGFPSDIMHRSWHAANSESWQSQSVCVEKFTESGQNDFMCKSWHYCTCTSTPAKKQNLHDPLCSPVKLENNQDLVNECDVCLPKLPSEIRKKDSDNLSSKDHLLYPKSSAGEAMISESNSEDECSSSIEEQSPSLSDTETSEEHSSRSIEDNTKKSSKMNYDLFLMTESTNSEIMGASSSEELET